MPVDCIYYEYGAFVDIPCTILNFEYKGLGGSVSDQHKQIITKSEIQHETADSDSLDKSTWDAAITMMAVDVPKDGNDPDENQENDIQIRSSDYKSAVGLALGVLNISDSNETHEDEDGDCIFCAGTGRTKENAFFCSHCGTSYHRTNKELEDVDIAELAGVYIPQAYRSKSAKFDRERIIRQLTESHNLNSSHKVAKVWLTALENYISKLRVHQVTPRQIIISTSPVIEKYTYEWVYSALEAALQGGYTTTYVLNPILIDVKKFANIDDDVLFFELVSESCAESVRKLEFICKYRMHRDKITFIITSLSITELDKVSSVSNVNGIYTLLCNYSYVKPNRILET